MERNGLRCKLEGSQTQRSKSVVTLDMEVGKVETRARRK